MKRWAAIVGFALLYLCSAGALQAQNVTVTGPVTAGDCVRFNSTTVIRDAGGACATTTMLQATPQAVTIGGTKNALQLTLVSISPPAALANRNTFVGTATLTNDGLVTASVVGVPGGPYNVYKGGPAGPSPLIARDIFATNLYSFEFDTTLNGGAGGFWLTGRLSASIQAANCAVYVPFNPPFQSGFTTAEGGATGGAGMAANAAGPQVPCMTGGWEWKGDQFQLTSPDPTGTTAPAAWNISAVAAGAASKARLTITDTSAITTGDKMGVSNAYNSDGSASNINGYWTVTKIDATHIDLDGSTYDASKTYSVASRTGFMSTGAADINPAYGCYHYVARYVTARVPQFNDGSCLFVWGGITTQTPDAAQPYGATQNFVVEPDMTVRTAHGLTVIGVEGVAPAGGARFIYPSLGIMSGVMTFDAQRLCGGGIDSNTKAGALLCDPGAGFLSTNGGVFSYNNAIGQPIADGTKGLIIKNNTGTPTTKIDIFLTSAVLQGPVVGAGGTNTVLRQTTTVYSETASLYQTIDTGATGLNGLRAADFPLTAGTTYYVFLLKNYRNGASIGAGSVGAFLTTSLDPTTFPAAANNGFTQGYYALLGQVRTRAGAATFDTFLIDNAIAQYNISAAETLAAVHCSTQNYHTQVLAGNASSYTITVGVVGNYLDDCQINVFNTDAANTKSLAVNGLSTYTLAALQGAVVQRVGANWSLQPWAPTTAVFAPSGTSGGIPYYNSTTSIASSALLTADQVVTGGGAGVAPKTTAAISATTTLISMAATNIQIADFIKFIPGTGAASNVQFYKDSTPSKAAAIGVNVPGSAVTDDFLASTYDGATWTRRMTLANSTGYVGIGTAGANSPGGTLTVSQNTTAAPSTSVVPVLWLVGADAGTPRITFDAFGGASQFFARRAGGTAASPTGVLVNQNLLSFTATGHNGTAYETAVRVEVVLQAAETWSTTANGTRINFDTTANTTQTLSTKWRIENAGDFLAMTDATYSIGALGATRPLHYYGAGLVQSGVVAVASLPTCNATSEGTRYAVNNSNAASFTAGIGAVVAAGGTTHVPVYCDGTNWRIG